MRTQIYLLRGEVEEAKRLMMLCSPMTPAYLTLRPAVQVRAGGGWAAYRHVWGVYTCVCVRGGGSRRGSYW